MVLDQAINATELARTNLHEREVPLPAWVEMRPARTDGSRADPAGCDPLLDETDFQLCVSRLRPGGSHVVECMAFFEPRAQRQNPLAPSNKGQVRRYIDVGRLTMGH